MVSFQSLFTLCRLGSIKCSPFSEVLSDLGEGAIRVVKRRVSDYGRE